MTRDTKIILKNTLLIVCCVATTAGFMRAADPNANAGIFLFLLWGIGPYLIFWVATWLLERFSSIPQVPGIGFGLSILIALYALAVYLLPLSHQSSTEGLIFIFAPLWLYILVLPALGICVVVAWLQRPDKRPD